MYLGETTDTIPLWVDEWRPPFGTLSRKIGEKKVPLFNYRCDHCGKEYGFWSKAPEPFFCTCNKLVSVEGQ